MKRAYPVNGCTVSVCMLFLGVLSLLSSERCTRFGQVGGRSQTSATSNEIIEELKQFLHNSTHFINGGIGEEWRHDDPQFVRWNELNELKKELNELIRKAECRLVYN